MALDGIKGSAPTSNSIRGFLQDQGMMHDFGTGVEELAHAAQNFGYAGSLPFHGWSLDQLSATLAEGKPVVVALGTNGADQPGHFVTVTGVSTDGKWVSYNDPTLGKQVISAEEFEHLWGLQGNSGVLVSKSLPAGAPVDYAPLVALAAGLMALISTTPLGAMRQGIGGRLSRSGGSRRKSTKSSSRSRRSKPKPKPRPKRKAKPKPRPRPRSKPKATSKPKPKPKPRPTSLLASRRSAPPRRPTPRPAPSKPSPKPSLFNRVKSAVTSVAKKARTVVSSVVKQTKSAITNTVNTAKAFVNRAVQKIVPPRTAPMAFKPNLGAAVAASGAASWRAKAIPQSQPPKKGLFSRIGSAVVGAVNNVKRSVSTVADSVRNTADTLINRVRTDVNRLRTGMTERANRVRSGIGDAIHRIQTKVGAAVEVTKTITASSTPTPIVTQTPPPPLPNTSIYGTRVPEGWTPTPTLTPEPTGTPSAEEILQAQLERDRCEYLDCVTLEQGTFIGDNPFKVDDSLGTEPSFPGIPGIFMGFIELFNTFAGPEAYGRYLENQEDNVVAQLTYSQDTAGKTIESVGIHNESNQSLKIVVSVQNSNGTITQIGPEWVTPGQSTIDIYRTIVNEHESEDPLLITEDSTGSVEVTVIAQFNDPLILRSIEFTIPSED